MLRRGLRSPWFSFSRPPQCSGSHRGLAGGDMPAVKVFDRAVKRRQRDRAASLDLGGEYEYLREHVANSLVDRLEDISRGFPYALDVGAHTGQIYRAVCAKRGPNGKGGVGGIERLVQADMSEQALLQGMYYGRSGGEQGDVKVETCRVLADEEFLPFKPGSFDLVLSNLSLHWVNDLPGSMSQVKQVLKPDGAFIGSMLGGTTLTELRRCLLAAEQEREGGQSVHTSPSAHVADCGNLLLSAGFSLPTVDQDTIRISYPNAFVLMEHLQVMGEGNASLNRRIGVSRDTFIAAAAAYQEIYGEPDGTVEATFQVVYMIGWSPHESQPTPKRRGSGQA
ncbi:unnamed protein product, partial [Discosporangium mesarthrocarpum]